MPHHWTDEAVEDQLEAGEAIVDLGQISERQRRRLARRAARGEIAKWRGHWTTLSPHFGFGPLKTIYAKTLPDHLIVT